MLTAPRRDILERSFCRCQKKIEKCGWRIFVLLDFSLLLSGEERECITGDFKTKHDLLLVICLHSQKSPNTQLCLTLSLSPAFSSKSDTHQSGRRRRRNTKNPSLCHRWCSSMLVQNDMRRWFSLSILKRNILSLSSHIPVLETVKKWTGKNTFSLDLGYFLSSPQFLLAFMVCYHLYRICVCWIQWLCTLPSLFHEIVKEL